MYNCPVCGFNKLSEQPYDDGNPSYEICNCCGFEFGYDDASEGHSFELYRRKWIQSGAIWFSQKEKPLKWDLKNQLENINVQL